MSVSRKPEYIVIAIACVSVAALAIFAFIVLRSGQTPQIPNPGNSQASECYTPEQSKTHIGESSCVDFNVGYTYETSAGTKFIDQYRNYSEGFQVYIPIGSSASSIPLSQFDGKKIRVTGEIRNYKGAVQITVTDSSQIKIFQ